MTLATTHRPRSFDGVVGQPVERIKAMIDGTDTPNYLLHGPPGTGKTTTARAIARELHGGLESYHELNASDDRGIESVRDKVTKYSQQWAFANGRRIPPVILLDECDSMTKEAQQALRAPMENHPAVFVLTANDLPPIHDAIKSRCHVFEFGPVPKDAIYRRLRAVCDREDFAINDDHLETLARKADGDMRSALNLLEQRARFTGETAIEQEVEQFVQSG